MTNGTTGGWTAEKEKTLRELWPDKNLSCADIGERVGMSRNAVIGKARRLGLGEKDWNRPVRGTSAPRPKRTRQQNGFAGVNAVRRKLRLDPEPFNESVEIAIPVGQRCTLMELTESTCRWPIGDPAKPDFYFCGGNAVTGLPYCSYHSRIAYQPPKSRTEKQKAHDARFWRKPDGNLRVVEEVA